MPLLYRGDDFPELVLTVPGGEKLTTPDMFAGNLGVLLLYRGTWSPTCIAQLRAFQEAAGALHGTRVAALSVDDQDSTAELAARNRLTFPIGYGADAHAVAGLTGAYINSDPLYLHPAGFIIGRQGKIILSIYSTGVYGQLLPQDVSPLTGQLPLLNGQTLTDLDPGPQTGRVTFTSTGRIPVSRGFRNPYD
jgi:peroxiredoxin